MDTDSISPLKIFWEALKDESSPGMNVYLDIISNPRFDVEQPSETDDGITDIFGDVIGATPLMLALHAGRGEVIETLLAAGATNSSDALMKAASEGNLAATKLLINAGADIGLSDSGTSPLHHAILSAHSEVIKTLAREGASLTLVDKNGHTPLEAFMAYSPFWLSTADLANTKALLTPKTLQPKRNISSQEVNL